MIFESSNIKYKSHNLPVPRPKWKQNRTYEDYIHLLRPRRKLIKFIDFLALPKKSVVLDIGFGEGFFLNYLKQERPDIKTIGVMVSECKTSLYENIDSVFIQYIPEDLTLLKEYINKVDVVTDIFGASTYANNPLHALIYSTFLLKTDGYYFSISSLIPEYENLSCFGDTTNRKKIKIFFQKYLGIKLFFEKKIVKSKTDLLIYFKMPYTEKKYVLSDYAEIIHYADKEIGIPIEKKSWKPFIGDFRIISYDYITYLTETGVTHPKNGQSVIVNKT